MCGIAGFSGEGNEADLEAMCRAIAHRGPDGEEKYIDKLNGVYLAHRRLAVLDISGGSQPMWNENFQIGVIFNGEIYNHAELRAALQLKGHSFRSDHSDTEVLVHGYEEWGSKLPEMLNGMFAFAILDKTNHCLFLARDRFGEKPLYYTQQSKFFGFASELTALRRHPSAVTTLDTLALQKYFAYGYIPSPRSLYKEVYKLPGGHWLRYHYPSKQLHIQKYWQFAIERDFDLARSPTSELCEQLRHLISSAVKSRMISDVPLGFFASGGIDSSIVVAEAAKILPNNALHTFSIGFNEPSFDESSFARAVAQHYKTQHHEYIFSMESAQSLAQHVLSRLDEPIADASLLPTSLLCEFARKHVTVAVGGDGSDELFAGYDPIRALAPANWYYKLMPKLAKKMIKAGVAMLPTAEGNMSLDFKLKRALKGLDYPPSVWLPTWMGPLDSVQITELLQQPISYETLYEDAIAAWEQTSADNMTDKSLEFFTRFYLQDNILTKVDRASMMVSLEVRSPFLDNHLVDFASRLPADLKYHNGCTKYLLKEAYKNILPNEIVRRPKKGFGIPLTAWLKQWPIPTISPQNFTYDHAWLNTVNCAHRDGIKDERLFLWSWLVLQAHLASNR